MVTNHLDLPALEDQSDRDEARSVIIAPDVVFCRTASYVMWFAVCCEVSPAQQRKVSTACAAPVWRSETRRATQGFAASFTPPTSKGTCYERN
jgi:hypothetical protein